MDPAGDPLVVAVNVSVLALPSIDTVGLRWASVI